MALTLLAQSPLNISPRVLPSLNLVIFASQVFRPAAPSIDRYDHCLPMGDLLAEEAQSPRPLPEKGRSRASTLTSLRMTEPREQHVPSSTTFPESAGVVSMLRTTTEMGDLDSVPGAPLSNRFQKTPRALMRVNGQTPSRTSSRYSQRTGSVKSKQSYQSFRDLGHSNLRPRVPSREQLAASHSLYNRGAFARSEEFASQPWDGKSSRSFTPSGVSTHVGEMSRSHTGFGFGYGLVGQRSNQELRSHHQLQRPWSPYSQPSWRPRRAYYGPQMAREENDRPYHESRDFPGQDPYASWNEPFYPSRRGHYQGRPDTRVEGFSHPMQYRPVVQPFRTGHPQENSWTVNHRPHDMHIDQQSLGASTDAGAISNTKHSATRLQPPAVTQKHNLASPPERYPSRIPVPGDAARNGFVQRVKNALEGREVSSHLRVVEPLTPVATALELKENVDEDHDPNASHEELSIEESHRTASSGSDKQTQKQNKSTQDAPEASTKALDGLFAGASSDNNGVARLTREMVKAAVGRPADLRLHRSQEATYDPDAPESGPLTVSSTDGSDDESPATYEAEMPVEGVKEHQNGDQAISAESDHSIYSDRTSGVRACSENQKINTSTTEDSKIVDERKSSVLKQDHYQTKTSPLRPKSVPLGMEHLMPPRNSPKRHQSSKSCPTAGDVSTRDVAISDQQTGHNETKKTHLSVLDGFLPDAATNSDTDGVSTPPEQSQSDRPLSQAVISGYSTIPRALEAEQQSRPSSHNTVKPSFGSSFDYRSVSPIRSSLEVAPYRHGQLSDLAEDSQESASWTNLRVLGAAPSIFKKLSKSRRVASNDRRRAFLSPPTPSSSYLRRSLSAVGKLPSFTFSRTDLTTKLNSALGVRASRSLEGLSVPFAASRTSEWLDARADSADLLPHRYASFFLKAESIEDIKESLKHHKAASNSSTVKRVDAKLLRELDRLSIPAMNVLSLRLSELLPNINSSQGDPGLDKEGKGSFLGKCSTAGSWQTVPHTASQQSSPRGGTVSKIKAKVSRTRLQQELPPISSDNRELTQYRYRIRNDRPKKRTLLSQHVVTAQPCPVGDPMEVFSFAKTVNPPLQNLQALDSNDFMRGMSLDICSRHQRGHEYAFKRGKVLRKTRSDVELPEDQITRIARSMSPLPRFNADLVPKSTHVSPWESSTSKSMASRVLGSLSRKIGLNGRATTGPDEVSLDPMFLHGVAIRDSTVVPGDRYPTSSLTSPIAIEFPEARSFFSDDSSLTSMEKRNRRAFFRRRLTRPKISRPEPLRRFESSSNTDGTGPSANYSTAATNNSDVPIASETVPSAGMGKIEFHARRAFEKLRVWTLHCGEMFALCRKGEVANDQDLVAV